MRVWDMPDDLYCALRFQQDPSYTGPNAVYANLICLTTGCCATAASAMAPASDSGGIVRAPGDHPGEGRGRREKVLEAEAALRELAAQFNRLPG